MAFASEQEDLNKQQQGQGTQVQPLTSSAPGSGPGTAAKSAPQATPSQPFQNLQAYLTANAPQIQNQANTIAGNLTGQYGQVQNDINQGAANFGNQVQSGYAQANPDLTGRAASNPSAFVQNPNDVAAFQSLYNDQYTGPSNFESSTGYGNLTGEVNKAIEQANLVGTIPGLQTYFQNQNPNATAGGNTLDSVLLQGSPEAFTTVQNAAKPFSNLTDYLNQAVTEANTGVTNAQNAAQNISQGLRGQFTGQVIPGFSNTLQNEVSQAQQQAQQRGADVQNLINNPGGVIPTTQQLSDLGLTASQWAQLQSNNDILNAYKTPIPGQPWSPYQGNFSLANYLNLENPQVAINPANYATPQEYATAAALQQLTGQDMSSILNPQNASQAGTANLDIANFSPNAGSDLTSAIQSQDFNALSAYGGLPQMSPGQFTQMAQTPGNPVYSYVQELAQQYHNAGMPTEPRSKAVMTAALRQGLFT